MHIKQFLILFLGLTYFTFSHAATYEWVDEKGITNYGDKVPAKYKNKAKIVEIKENVISAPVIPNIKNDADDQAVDPEESKPIVLEVPASKNLPNSQVKPDDSCETRMRKYEESQICFAQYRNVRGGINEEGIKRCTPVQQPDCVSTDR
ncbi:MAG: DUF4124 domain-containing protein [Pseudomonadota bacterium]